MVLVVLSELPQWLQQDGAKLFFFACVVFALFAATKWASRKSESSYEASAPTKVQEPEPVEEPETPAEVEEDSDWLPPMREVEFSVRSMRFKNFEFEDGPKDPDCFCDDLEVELNYKNGIMPWGECVVATPKGLEAKLGDAAWTSYYAKQIFVVTRYDPVEIHTAVLNHIRVELESVPEEVAEDEMKDAQGAG